MNVDLHLVSFDVPYPANYGGVIDVYSKLKALHRIGVKVALHCFEYGRGKQEELNKWAEQVYYYPRELSFVKQISLTPFIVKSRTGDLLLKNLNQGNAPIVFEGLHTTAILKNYKLENRIKWVRAHNIEHHYYAALAHYHQSIVKKLYYKVESKRLKRYQKILSLASGVLAISPSDHDYFQKQGFNSLYLPAFHDFESYSNQGDVKEYALYHGNLEIEENVEATEFLIEVFKHTDRKLVVAGRNPSIRLAKKINSFRNIELKENPNDEELSRLIREAKISCLPTFQNTGIKLKLIRSLLQGNVVLTNQKMVEGSGLEKYVELAESKLEWNQRIEHFFESPTPKDSIDRNKEEIRSVFNGKVNAHRMMEWLVPVR